MRSRPLLTPRRSHKGYAMALMILVLGLLTTITVTMVSSAYSSQTSSKFVASRSEAKGLAVSALEELFARMNAGSGSLEDVLADHPAAAPGWARLPMGSQRLPDGGADAALGAEPCPTGTGGFAVDCYQITVDAGRDALNTVDVTLRTRCAGTESRCVYTAFQQTLRRVQFFDFAVSYEYATLAPEALFPLGSFDPGGPNAGSYASYRDACTVYGLDRRDVEGSWPAVTGVSSHTTGAFTADPVPASTIDGCIDVAYQADGDSGDQLTGRVYTADDFVTVCGAPSFDQILVSGPGVDGKAWVATSVDGTDPCGSSGPVFSGRLSDEEVLDAPLLNLPDAYGVLDAARATPGALVVGKASADVPVRVTFTPTGVSITGSTGDATNRAYDGSVVVVEGDLRAGSTDVLVSGTVRGAVSLVVGGSAAIDGDLVYAGGATRDNATDVLSLTATERVEIWQACPPTPPAPSSTACLSSSVPLRRVHAILTAPQGFVGVPDWQTNVRPGGSTQRLELFGAVASLYQGVFGAYSETDGTLVSGFAKAFTFDDRLTRFTSGQPTLERLPAYLVQSTRPIWERFDVIETAYEDPQE